MKTSSFAAISNMAGSTPYTFICKVPFVQLYKGTGRCYREVLLLKISTVNGRVVWTLLFESKVNKGNMYKTHMRGKDVNNVCTFKNLYILKAICHNENVRPINVDKIIWSLLNTVFMLHTHTHTRLYVCFSKATHWKNEFQCPLPKMRLTLIGPRL